MGGSAGLWRRTLALAVASVSLWFCLPATAALADDAAVVPSSSSDVYPVGYYSVVRDATHAHVFAVPGGLDAVLVLNDDGSLVSEIPLGQWADPSGLTISPDDSSVFVGYSGHIARIDTTTLAVTQTVDGVGSPGDLAYAGGRLWWCIFGLSPTQLHSVDAVSLADQQVYYTDRSWCPAIQVSNKDPDVLLVAGDHRFDRLDVSTSSPSVIDSVADPNHTMGWGLAQDASGAHIFLQEDNALKELDGTTLAEIISHPVGQASFQVAASPDGSSAVVSTADGHTYLFSEAAADPVATWNYEVRLVRFSPEGKEFLGYAPWGGLQFAVDVPTSALADSQLTIDSAPAQISTGDAVTLSGNLTGPADPTPTSVDVFRMNLVSNRWTTIKEGTAVPQPDGSWALDVVAPAAHRQPVFYYAYWTGDASHVSALASKEVPLATYGATLTVALSPASGTIPSLAPVTVSGQLTLADAASGAQTVSVLRGPDYGNMNVVGTAITQADGTFTYVDHPSGNTSVQYEVIYDDARHALAWAAAGRLTVSMLNPNLALTVKPKTGTVGKQETLTATLGGWYDNKTVEIYAQPQGGARTLIASGEVGANGTFTTTYVPTDSTTYEAEYAGDGRYYPDSVRRTPDLKWGIDAQMIKYAKRSGQYAIYKANSKVYLDITLSPDHSGKPVFVNLGMRAPGGWAEGRFHRYMMPEGSELILWAPAGVFQPGRAYRWQVAVGGDGKDFVYTESPYVYFKVQG